MGQNDKYKRMVSQMRGCGLYRPTHAQFVWTMRFRYIENAVARE